MHYWKMVAQERARRIVELENELAYTEEDVVRVAVALEGSRDHYGIAYWRQVAEDALAAYFVGRAR